MRKKRAGLYLLLLVVILLLTGCSDKNLTTVSYTGYGACETVGGSMHQLSIGTRNYIIDAGAFYGDEGSNYPLPEELDIEEIDAVFVTHAHADHIGRIPLLLEMGYDGPIYMTEVSKDITIVSSLSNIKYTDLGMEEFYYSKNNTSEEKPVYLERFSYGQYEVKEKNRVYIKSKREELSEKGFYLHKSTVEHLETEMRDRLESQIVAVDYGEMIELSEGVEAEFFYTSHLPGSAMIYFTAGDKTILFSGDIGSDNNPFLPENEKFERPVDYLFVEGTYGTKEKGYDAEKERAELIEYIGNAIRNKERVIIPAFAVDRSQQVLYEIRNGMEKGIIPKDTCVKVFSPTIEEVNDLYVKYSKNKEAYGDYFSEAMFTDIFDIQNLQVNPRKADGKAYDLQVSHGEIAIMTSGMITNGFSKEILKSYVEDVKTHIISVSYQDPDEIGGMLFVKGQERIKIDGETYEVKASILDASGFSGHACVEQIQEIFENIAPDQIRIIHLNDYDKEELREYYTIQFEEAEVIILERLEESILYGFLACGI